MANLTSSPFNEIFVQEVEEKLFRNNKFLNYVQNTSDWLSGRTVHIPQYNHNPTVNVDFEKSTGSNYDFNSFNSQRPSEANLTFNVESYQLEPLHVTDFEDLITNYRKFEVAIGQSINRLTENMGDRALYRVGENVPASNFFSTTGASGSGNGYSSANKLKATVEDILKIAEKMDNDNLPSDSRYIVLPTVMYWELLRESNIIRADYYGSSTLPTGEFPQIGGINILKRSEVLATNDASTATAGSDLLDPFTEGWDYTSNGDSYIALAFQSEGIAAAWDSPKTYIKENDPFKFGNIVSAECKLGASASRIGLDDAGVYLLMQSN